MTNPPQALYEDCMIQPYPQVDPEAPFKGVRETLAQAATHYLTDVLLDHEYSLRPVNGRSFGEECYARFLTFSDDTLVQIARFGMEAEYEGEALYEYDCMAMLITAQAEEDDFINLLAMSDYFAEQDMTDSDETLSLSLPLKLYDRYIQADSGRDNLTLEERIPYYSALLDATMALEKAITKQSEIAISTEDDYGLEQDDDDGSVPSILYCEVAPDQSHISSSPVIEDDKMINFVIRNVERINEITSFIVDRSEVDSETISEYLSTHPRPIANGAL